MHDGALRPGQRLEGALDQLLAALDEHLDLDVVGDEALSMIRRWKSKSVWRGRREPDLDLLEADVDQRLEQRQLALGVHGVDEGLVAVAQVDAGPRGAPVNWRSGQVRSCSTSGTCERYLPNGMGDGSQGRARRPRSYVATIPFLSLGRHSCSSLLCRSLVTSGLASVLVVRPVPAQQKTPWPFGAGGCERTRCGVRRQVSSSSEFVGFTVMSRNCPISGPSVKGGSDQARGMGEPKRRGCPRDRCGPPPTRRSRDRRGPTVSPTPAARHSAWRASASSMAR